MAAHNVASDVEERDDAEHENGEVEEVDKGVHPAECVFDLGAVFTKSVGSGARIVKRLKKSHFFNTQFMNPASLAAKWSAFLRSLIPTIGAPKS